ncbi:2-oxo-4-hydroxy-4-carboxy-5-ureidoimidazoline decarboxylase [Streptomyces maoxianensis]|uniref:2-oxo-4-hydroxy-4-carboxy-5-ureidoimidazoline decarboxylase n=1 Tax=Streptomyces maoxianensis TaxID=1459942 RepID=A0ABV9FXC7_9ACTN
MSSESHAGLPKRPPTLHHTPRALTPSAIPSQSASQASQASPASGPAPPPDRRRGGGLERFNTAPADAAEATLLACCGSRRWAQRLVAHRPYPDLDALLAAADEASYDLSPADLCEALADESSAGVHPAAPQAAHTALGAAHAAYESRFGHAFVICLDGYHPEEYLDQVLAGIRARLGHEPDEERALSAEQLRGLARSRLAHVVANHPESDVAGASR